METEMIGALSVDLLLDSAKYNQGTKSAQKSIKNLQGAVKKSSRSMQVVDSSLAGLSRSVGAIGGPFGGMAGQIGAFRSGLTSMNPVLAITIGSMAALGAATAAGLKTFSDAEQAMLKTEALLKATGHASGFTAKQLDEMARSTARATLASTEQIRAAQGVLVTFKSISGANFERTISLAQDMAAVFGGDAKASATQLGKALEDPIKGLSALSRVGVTFSANQKEVINNLVETGKTAAAQQEILKTLEGQIGGAGGAEAGGLAGAFDSLTQASGELFEKWVKVSGIGSTVTDVVNNIAHGLNNVTAAMEDRGDIEWLETEIQRLEELNSRYQAITVQGEASNTAHLDELKEELALLKALKKEDEKEAAAAADKSARIQAEADAHDALNRQKAAALTAREAEKAANDERIAEFETIRTSLLTATEAENEYYAARKLALEEFILHNSELEAEANEQKELEYQRHTDALANIESRANAAALSQQKKDDRAKQGAQNDFFNNLISLSNTKSKALFRISQIAAVSRAVLSARESIPHAFKWGMEIGGPPLAAAFATAAAAATAAQIASITSTKFGGGSSAVSSAAQGGATPVYTQPVTPTIPTDTTGGGGTNIYINNVNGRDAMELLEELRDTIDTTDFVLINGDTANAQAIRGAA